MRGMRPDSRRGGQGDITQALDTTTWGNPQGRRATAAQNLQDRIRNRDPQAAQRRANRQPGSFNPTGMTTPGMGRQAMEQMRADRMANGGGWGPGGQQGGWQPGAAAQAMQAAGIGGNNWAERAIQRMNQTHPSQGMFTGGQQRPQQPETGQGMGLGTAQRPATAPQRPMQMPFQNGVNPGGQTPLGRAGAYGMGRGVM